MEKEIKLTGHKVRSRQRLFLILSIILLPVVIFTAINAITLFHFAYSFMYFIIWSILIFVNIKLSEAKLINDEVFYKGLFSKEKRFSLKEIIQIKIVFKDFILVKYKKNYETGSIFLLKTARNSMEPNAYKLLNDALKKIETKNY